MSKPRDITSLNARSLALSALLGTHPPTLAASALVALAELFDISAGSMRTALSRLVAAGDVVTADGRYSLTPRLVARQTTQDVGRRSPGDWDGAWHTAIATADHRDLADRRRARTLMTSSRFAELRPTVWLRPANLPPPSLGGDRPDWLITTGRIDVASQHELVAQLWDLETIGARARRLDDDLRRAAARIDPDDPRDIPGAFVLSANIVRFLRDEPVLPIDLTPPEWPVAGLRYRYDDFESLLQAMMRPFLHEHGT